MGNFSPKTVYFSSSKYEQGSKILSFTYGENLAQIQAKELPKKGDQFAIFKKKQPGLPSVQKTKTKTKKQKQKTKKKKTEKKERKSLRNEYERKH